MTSSDDRPVDPAGDDTPDRAAPPPAPQPPASQPVPGMGAAFDPVPPEPVARAEIAPATTVRKRSSSVLTAVVVGAVIVAAVGVAFAVGRASSASSTAGARAVPGTGAVPGAQGNGQGPLAGRGPEASFDLSGGVPGDGGFDGDPDGGLGLDRGFGRGFGPGGLTGTVKAIDADSMTVELANGQVVMFGLDGSTAYHQQVAASASDVKAGATVQVMLGQGFRPGQVAQGDDGSITLGPAGTVTVLP